MGEVWLARDGRGFVVEICPVCRAQQFRGGESHYRVDSGPCPNEGKVWAVEQVEAVPLGVYLAAVSSGGDWE